MSLLHVHRAGPSMTLQDLGWTGTLRLGLSRGGAADRLALLEGAALLGHATPRASIEMAGAGGRFSTDTPTRIALTGAPMRATLDGTTLAWNATHLLPPGAMLEIGPALSGVYGYLGFAGGIAGHEMLGSRATHLSAGIGRRLKPGDTLPIGPDSDLGAPAMRLDAEDRFSGGDIRIVQGPQTSLYSGAERDRFANTEFQRSSHGNRQGVRLDHDGAPFQAENRLGIVSDVIIPGDIQMTGEGVPFVLLPECQTIGGYPRIGAVIPADLARVAQAPPGAPLRFQFLDLAQSDALFQNEALQLAALRAAVQPMLRNPHDIADLLGYQLISGATAGDDLERP